MNNNLVLPEAVEIELITSRGFIDNNDILCFCLHLFAKNKVINETEYKWFGFDYIIKPIFSNGNRVYIPKGFITAYTYYMPHMEYRGIENCFNFIEITMMSEEDIQEAISFVKSNGFSGSMSNAYGISQEKYINNLINAKNGKWMNRQDYIKIRDLWDGDIIKLYTLKLTPVDKGLQF